MYSSGCFGDDGDIPNRPCVSTVPRLAHEQNRRIEPNCMLYSTRQLLVRFYSSNLKLG